MLRRALQLRPGESTRTLLLFTYLFLVITGYVITKATRDALFLNRFTAAQLPFVDIASAVAVTIVMGGYLRISRRARLPVLIVGTLLAFAASAAGFWVLARTTEPLWMLPVLYVWASVAGVLLPAQVWTLASSTMTTREAKRLFSLVGAGAITGGILGGSITKFAAQRIGAENLLLVMAVLIAVCPFLVPAIWRGRHRVDVEREDEGPATHGLKDSALLVWRSSHLRVIASLVAVSSVVTTIVTWQFKAVSKAAIPNTNDLAALFGAFNMYAGLLSLAAQLAISARLLKRFGLGPALLVVPVALAMGSAGLLLSGALWAALLLKGSDQVLRYSIDRSTVELLYLPIPARLMSRAKALIDTAIYRTGDGLGALLVLAALALHRTPAQMSVLTLVLLVAWIRLAMLARRHYVESLTASIYEHRLETERVAERNAERSMIAVLTSALDAGDPVVRRDAIAALASAGERAALPQVEVLLADSDRDVRTEALMYLAQFGEVDPLTRVADLGDVHQDGLTTAIAHFLAQPGATGSIDAIQFLLNAAPPEHRQQIPGLLQRIGTPEAEQLLVEYLLDADPVLRLNTVAVLNKVRRLQAGSEVEREEIETVLEAEIFGHYRSYQQLAASAQAAGEPDTVRQAMEREIERIFRLLKLLLPQHDLHSAYVGLQSGNPAIHANALEFLEDALPARVRGLLLPLIDSEVTIEERLRIAEQLLGPFEAGLTSKSSA